MFPLRQILCIEMSGLIDLLTGKGNSLIGSVWSDAEAVAFVKANFPGRAYCLVADWTLVDVSVSDEQTRILATLGLAASIVYALCVIEDSRGQFLPGDWLKSSYGASTRTRSITSRLYVATTWKRAMGWRRCERNLKRITIRFDRDNRKPSQKGRYVLISCIRTPVFRCVCSHEHHQSNRRSCFCVSRDSVKNLKIVATDLLNDPSQECA